jgi:hypothetical protein
MDQAVAVVEAYLRVNGYLTVAEYPVLDTTRHRPVQTVTDLDILAIRLATGADQESSDGRPEVDPALGAQPGRTDMIVGEVKEGAPRLNRALREPKALQAALTRFGCCTATEADDVVERLLRHGTVVTPAGHTIRIVAFGNPHGSPATGPWHTVSLDHVLGYLQDHLRSHWDQVGHSQLKDPTLGLLALLEKSTRAGHQTQASR